jgi:hypothetical protein
MEQICKIGINRNNGNVPEMITPQKNRVGGLTRQQHRAPFCAPLSWRGGAEADQAEPCQPLRPIRLSPVSRRGRSG